MKKHINKSQAINAAFQTEETEAYKQRWNRNEINMVNQVNLVREGNITKQPKEDR